jgi:hypothetical protein
MTRDELTTAVEDQPGTWQTSDVSSTPEPSTLALVSLSGAGLLITIWLRRKPGAQGATRRRRGDLVQLAANPLYEDSTAIGYHARNELWESRRIPAPEK